MSLWEVSGVTAQAMMEAYYRRLVEGLGRGEAIHRSLGRGTGCFRGTLAEVIDRLGGTERGRE